MKPLPATNASSARTAAGALLLVGLLSLPACESGPPPYTPGKLDAAQIQRCRELEKAYREKSPEFQRLRDELAEDPVAAGWVTRMFVRDVMSVREGRQLDGDAELLRAAAGFDNPVEGRAIEQLQSLGEKAVPTLVGDLLQHSQPQPRELGVELLARIGEAAVPALQQAARTGRPKNRRAAARSLGHIGATGAVMTTLREMAFDDDFTIRADALRSMHKGGDEARTLLIERMTGDDDKFVRKVAAQTLARFEDAEAAEALVQLLERSKAANDLDNEVLAQDCLMQMSGRRRPRSVAAWRTFVKRLQAGGPR